MCAAVVAEKLPRLWGKPPKRVLLHVSKDVVMSFCVAGVALCDIDVCEEESGAQPSWQKSCRFYEGKSQKRVFLDVSEDVLMSSCAAGVPLCDIRRV